MTQAVETQRRGKRRSAVKIMGNLVGLVRPLMHWMVLAVILGAAGYFCAVFLTILAGKALLQGLLMNDAASVKTLCIGMAVLAGMRGILHYAEQYCNHFIAFKLLAIIRHQVFEALRKLCPAKLEGRDRGNLISIITTDIELLEVFYAHTISPIAIAVLVSGGMIFWISRCHPAAGIFALAAYLTVGVWIPVRNGKRGGAKGMEFRTGFGELNSFVLDSLRGLDETLQYGQGENRKKEMEEKSCGLTDLQTALGRMEGAQRAGTNLVILAASFGMLFLTLFFYQRGVMTLDGVVTATISMMGSFGPVVALSSLSNNLNQTLASGERVLAVLEEEPVVEEVPENQEEEREDAGAFTGAEAAHVTFSYDEEVILKDFSMKVPAGKIVGIHGVSGSGKSTFLKLLMRFWDAEQGEIRVDGKEIQSIATRRLRNTQSYVTQETCLFHDSIANNIAVGKPGASRKEIEEAAKKASLHDFIESLPQGYDTEVGELGETLSGGERQRIGIARAFLRDAPMILMDEPTSNLDALNEGIILKSLKREAGKKTIVLVSHRKSTMQAADQVFEMENGRAS